MDRFKLFLITEHKFYLAQKAGDLLTAMQNLEGDAPNMGSRAMIRAVTGVVNQVRRILHGSWDDSEVQYLKSLQKIGVALMKAIDEKENMQEVMASCNNELEEMLKKLDTPINSLGSEDVSAPDEDEEPLSPGSQIGA